MALPILDLEPRDSKRWPPARIDELMSRSYAKILA